MKGLRRLAGPPARPTGGRLREDWLGTIFAPRETFAALSARPAPRRAGAAVFILGVLWALLFAWLASDDRAPTFQRWLPFPPSSFYRAASFYALPLLLLLWLGGGQVVHVLCGQRSPIGASLGVLGFTLAVPATVTFVIPDLVVYGFNGQLGLTEAVRVTGPLTLLWSFGLTALALRTLHRLSRLRAVGNTLILFVILSIPASLFLR
ncbi:MAG: YIP1 family protein [bacterium]